METHMDENRSRRKSVFIVRILSKTTLKTLSMEPPVVRVHGWKV